MKNEKTVKCAICGLALNKSISITILDSVKRQLKKNGNILGKPHHRQICSRHYPSDCLIVSDSRTKPGLKNENKHELPTLHLDRKKPNQTGNGIEVVPDTNDHEQISQPNNKSPVTGNDDASKAVNDRPSSGAFVTSSTNTLVESPIKSNKRKANRKDEKTPEFSKKQKKGSKSARGSKRSKRNVDDNAKLSNPPVSQSSPPQSSNDAQPTLTKLDLPNRSNIFNDAAKQKNFLKLRSKINEISDEGLTNVTAWERTDGYIKFQWKKNDQVLKQVELTVNMILRITIDSKICYMECTKELTTAELQGNLIIVNHSSSLDDFVPKNNDSIGSKIEHSSNAPLTTNHSNENELNLPEIDMNDSSMFSISKFKLTADQFQRLHWSSRGEAAYLDDQIINYYMTLICERSRANANLPKVHAMDVYFMEMLLFLDNPDSIYIESWVKQIDIFTHDFLIVPVNGNRQHWSMVIICIQSKVIKNYDSLLITNDIALKKLVQYIEGESRRRNKAEFECGWTVENVRNIPRQYNGHDCGVFSCMYAEFVTRNQPLQFSQQNMIYFRKKMIREICTGQLLT